MEIPLPPHLSRTGLIKSAFHINGLPYYGSKLRKLSPGFLGVEGQLGANLILRESSVEVILSDNIIYMY